MGGAPVMMGQLFRNVLRVVMPGATDELGGAGEDAGGSEAGGQGAVGGGCTDASGVGLLWGGVGWSLQVTEEDVGVRFRGADGGEEGGAEGAREPPVAAVSGCKTTRGQGLDLANRSVRTERSDPAQHYALVP